MIVKLSESFKLLERINYKLKQQTMNKILNHSKKALAIVGFVIAASLVTVSANAQGTPAGPGTSGSGVKANGQAASGTGAPIDGGASLLIVATVAYTGRKLSKMKGDEKKLHELV